MRLRTIMVAAACALGMVLGSSAAPAFAATNAWGQAIEVPGTATLNNSTSPFAQTQSVSCPSSGNCGAGGEYQGSGGQQAFVVSQTAGTWGQAIEVPGLAALNAGEFAEVNSVSCASAGNCTAGGYYQDSSHDQQAFVVTQTGGSWGPAIEVPGSAGLNAGGDDQVISVSCASAGNCTAVGWYSDSSGQDQPFAATQTGGTWGGAVELPGTAAKGLSARSVSCTAPGTCVAAGGGYDGPGPAFVAAEHGGTWSAAQAIPGLAALDAGGEAVAWSVSCPSAGNCAIAGYYTAANGSQQGFLATEHNGTWGQAQPVPGLSALGNGLGSDASTISCPAAGNCIVGGTYTYNEFATQGFTVTDSSGVWGQAATIPNLSTLNKGSADVTSVSCSSKGNCAIGGSYFAGLGAYTARPFVANETGGVLRSAQRLPGILRLTGGGGHQSQVLTVSCARGGTCALGGWYVTNKTGATQAMVDSQG